MIHKHLSKDKGFIESTGFYSQGTARNVEFALTVAKQCKRKKNSDVSVFNYTLDFIR